jgi:hypothetical protein
MGLAKGFHLAVTAFIMSDHLLSSFSGAVARIKFVSPLAVTLKHLEESTTCVGKVDERML